MSKIKLDGSIAQDIEGNDLIADSIEISADGSEVWGVNADGTEAFRLRGISASVVKVCDDAGTELNYLALTTDATDDSDPIDGTPDIEADGVDSCTITIQKKNGVTDADMTAKNH